MQTFGAFIVSLIAAGGMTAALPTENQNTVSVPVTYNAKFVPDGPTALYKAYRKYNTSSGEHLAAAVANKVQRLPPTKRQSGGTGSATNVAAPNDQEYLTEVSIGTPAQNLNLDFDTGSSDLWVFSTETPSNEVGSQTLYNPGASSSAKKLSGATWSISYGDHSSSSGDVYTDTVTVGGFTVGSQAVESAQQVSSQFTSDSLDGLLGLAFSSINTVKPKQQQTWFANAAPNLQSALFTANLNHQADGTYNFGYIDTSIAKGPIAYTPVDNSQGFWGFTSPGYAVGSGSINSDAIQGIADTGTSLLLLDDAIVAAYYAQVQGAQNSQQSGGYIFACSATLPDFTFGVGSSTITVPGSYINYSTADSTGQNCYGGIQSNGGSTTIFGDIALKAALVVFDQGNMQLGWAQKV